MIGNQSSVAIPHSLFSFPFLSLTLCHSKCDFSHTPNDHHFQWKWPVIVANVI